MPRFAAQLAPKPAPGSNDAANGFSLQEAAPRTHGDGEHHAAERMIPREDVPEPERYTQDPSPHRNGGQHAIDEVHAARSASGTPPRAQHENGTSPSAWQASQRNRCEALGRHATAQGTGESRASRTSARRQRPERFRVPRMAKFPSGGPLWPCARHRSHARARGALGSALSGPFQRNIR